MRAAGGSWGQSWWLWGQQQALLSVQRPRQVSCQAVSSAVLSQLRTHPLASAPVSLFTAQPVTREVFLSSLATSADSQPSVT